MSSNHEQHIPQLICGMDGQRKVPFYKWSAYLSNYFKSIRSILSYHNFSVIQKMSVTRKTFGLCIRLQNRLLHAFQVCWTIVMFKHCPPLQNQICSTLFCSWLFHRQDLTQNPHLSSDVSRIHSILRVEGLSSVDSNEE